MFFAFSINLNAQVSHIINSGSYYYTPTNLTIDVGDTVTWINDGGLHNVNFAVSTITGLNFNNPESFTSSPTTGPTLYTHVFTIPGHMNMIVLLDLMLKTEWLDILQLTLHPT